MPEGKSNIDSAPDDPDLVTWDGDNDPQNPMNWPEKKKWSNLGILSLLTLITYVALFQRPAVARSE